MRYLKRVLVRAGTLLLSLGALTPTASATPEVTITPPSGARFLAGQRFDLRVEGRGTGPFSATLSIDGVAQTFTSGVQGSTTTDGISSPGYGGFNIRGYSTLAPGHHTITATFTDATGTADASADFEVFDVGGAGRKIRNIIIMLGDGMGVAHRTAARIVRHGVTAGQPDGYLNMDRFPGTGLVTTHSLDSVITDSAPGMSGYVSGNHNRNGQEGVYPANMTNPFYYPRVEYLSEFLHRTKGTTLGIVSTADLEDATPAANAIHTGNRGAGQGICDQYLDERSNTGLSVLLGGGRRWFLPAGQFGSSRGTGNDYGPLPADLASGWGVANPGAVDGDRNLLNGFIGAGFTYLDSGTELQSVINGQAPFRLLGLFGYGNMNVALDKIAKRRSPGSHLVVDDYHAPDQPMLDEMTRAAIKVLRKNPLGFVLMVEGAHIDKQSHLMDADRVIGETIEFDRAVGVARQFADEVQDTLVLVLADHECSGFSIIGGLAGGIEHLRGLGADNATLDPLQVPLRQNVVGVYEGAGFPHYAIAADGYPESFDIDGKLLVGYGASADRFEDWLSKPLPVIDSLLPTNIRTELLNAGYVSQPVERPESQYGFFLRGQAAGRTNAVHTAADIPVSAFSRTSYWLSFVGVQTNTDVFFKLMRAALGGGIGSRGSALDDMPDGSKP